MTSPASAPSMVKPRMRLPSASTIAFRKPRVSEIVRDRNTATIGSFATRTAMPWRWASRSLKPTRASGGSVNMQYGTSRLRVVRSPPARLSRMIRKSSNDTWVNCGLPAHSPTAQTSDALVSSRSLTATYPRVSSATPARSSPIPLGVGERLCRRKARKIRDRGMCPEIESHAIAGQHARTAVVQTHLDGLGRDEPARAHDQLGAAGLVIVEVHGDQAVDHIALARQHLLHVGGGGTRHRSEPIRVVNQIGDLRAPDLVLTGKAVGCRTGTADQFALYKGGAMPRLGHVPG